MFHSVQLVQKIVAKEPAPTKGALLYDSWTINRLHFVGLYASFNSTVPVRGNGQAYFKPVSKLILLALAPITQVNVSDECSDEAIRFNEESHTQFFREILENTAST